MSAPGGIEPGGAPEASVQNALATLKGLLTVDETLEAWAIQHRLYALTHRRLLLAATSGRFITLTRHLFGGYDSADIRWQDLRETRISAGILAADLTLVAQTSSDLSISSEVNRMWTFTGLRKDQAQSIYRICQQHDQVWREKRRVRELEELRAKSGGVQFGGAAFGGSSMGAAGLEGGGGYGTAMPGVSAPGAATPGESEAARRIRQAREMLDAKLISDAEFESIKAKIIAGL